MKMVFNKYVRMTLIVFWSLIMITGCNSNSGSSIGGNGVNQTSAYFGGKNLSNKANVSLNIEWTVDGFDFGNGTPKNTPFLLDAGWHLLTLTVQNQSTPLESAIAINGLQSTINPAPVDQRGESVQITDINCRTARFSKNGDSCSVYVRISYDYQKTGIANPPTIYAQFATNAYPSLPNIYSINVEPLLDRMQGDYRDVLSIESIGGATILSNPSQYQVLQMQNISLPNIFINKVTPLTNPNFALIHRTTNGNDPYYGLESECAITPNPGLGQTNLLKNLNDTCILVYQAAASATQIVESDFVTLGSTAEITAPWTSNTFNLIANYAPGTPIPESAKDGANFTVTRGSAHPEGTDMVMDTSGDLSSGTIVTPEPFNSVNVSYTLAPRVIPADSNVSYNMGGGTLALSESCIYNPNGDNCTMPVQVGNPILTNLSTTNPITAGSVYEKVQDSSSGYATNKTVNACGGSTTSADLSLISRSDIAKHHLTHAYINVTSNAFCYDTHTFSYSFDVPLNGPYSNVVFENDQLGCDGGNWDKGGRVTLVGDGCNNKVCPFRLVVEAWHGGVPGQCQDHQSQSFPDNINQPQIFEMLQNLNNFNYTSPQFPFMALGGQNLSAWFGGQGALLNQNIACDFKGSSKACTMSGVYQNGTSATSMVYQPGQLNAGDHLKGGTVNFNRSEGYDLSSFISPHRSQGK